MKASEEFCPECGATIAQGTTAEGSDRAIYPELARANLLRMRGEYKQAQDVCRAILRRYPNNMTANSLLGDISAEANELDQAVQWYELALDIQPDNAAVRQKLDTVKRRMELADTNTVAAQLGLPPERPKTGLLAAGMIGVILLVSIIAYVVGTRVQAGKTGQPQVTKIEAPQVGGTTPNLGDEPSNGAGNVTPEGDVPAGAYPASSNEDRAVLQMVSQRAEDGAKLTSVVQDPRTGSLTLTFGLADGDDPKTVAARLAKGVFDNVSAASSVTLRGLQGGVVAFVADSRRDLYQATQAPEWRDQHKDDPTAWILHILQNIWPAEAATTGGGPSTPPVDSGTAPPTGTTGTTGGEGETGTIGTGAGQ